jgi:transposase
MSLDPSPIEPVPEETARVARAIFPKGNRYLLLRDTLGTLFTDPLFADLFPSRGQPALARLSAGPGHPLSVYRRAAGSASG